MSTIVAIIGFAKLTPTNYTWKARQTLLEKYLFPHKEMLFPSHKDSTKDPQRFQIFNSAAQEWKEFRTTTRNQNLQFTRFQDEWTYLHQQRRSFFQRSNEGAAYYFTESTSDISWISKHSTLEKIFRGDDEEHDSKILPTRDFGYILYHGR